MVLLNLWSLGHFLQWTAIGCFLLKNWPVFFLLSIGWEVLELYLPFDFVTETWDNKISDLVVNTIGFALGLRLRSNPLPLK
jgi:glycopeptide antibiotics resistance protein